MVKKLKPGETAPFVAHLSELRDRLIRGAICVMIFFAVAWFFSDILLQPIVALMKGSKPVFINPTEAFFVHMKVAFYAALAVSIPFLLYQAWSFVSPGLLENEQRYVLPFILCATVLFAAGAAFCYFLVLPFGLNFLLGYGGGQFSPMISIAALVGFCLTLMFVFGLIFQLPLVVIFLNLAGMVTAEQLASFRPYLIVISFILSAIITPPDIFTQAVLAVPLVLLYEISIVLIRLFGRKEDGVEK